MVINWCLNGCEGSISWVFTCSHAAFPPVPSMMLPPNHWWTTAGDACWDSQPLVPLLYALVAMCAAKLDMICPYHFAVDDWYFAEILADCARVNRRSEIRYLFFVLQLQYLASCPWIRSQTSWRCATLWVPNCSTPQHRYYHYHLNCEWQLIWPVFGLNPFSLRHDPKTPHGRSTAKKPQQARVGPEFVVTTVTWVCKTRWASEMAGPFRMVPQLDIVFGQVNG